MTTREQLLDTMWETAADTLNPPLATFAAVGSDAAHLANTILSIHAMNVAEQSRPTACWPADRRTEDRMLHYANKIRSIAESKFSEEQQRQLRLVIDGTRLAQMVVEAI
jgi:hypothetical protein